MFRLLIVDDEEIEREGMAAYIPWRDYGIVLAGTARNGVEGLDMVAQVHPDIVLTDIKMPVMDGIEMIRKIRETNPETEFIVLSGYGEYEFTSQAMAEGVRHYLLKPCDEEKIAEVLEKLLAEMKVKRNRIRKEQEDNFQAERIAAQARSQMFTHLLLDANPDWEEYQPFLQELGGKECKAALLVFFTDNDFTYMDGFIVENMLTELLADGQKTQVLASTSTRKKIQFLLDGGIKKEYVKAAVERVQKEFLRIGRDDFWAVMSEAGLVGQLYVLYGQIEKLIRIVKTERGRSFFCYDELYYSGEDFMRMVSLNDIRGSVDYGELLFEFTLLFIKMQLESFDMERKKDMVAWLMETLYGLVPDIEPGEGEQEQSLLLLAVEKAAEEQGLNNANTREVQLVHKIQRAAFCHLQERDLSIQFLAKKVLYMNEDYLSRVFARNMEQKFSSWLQEQRMKMAMCLIRYDPGLKVSELAVITGYAPDGQYFAKTFRRHAGMAPTEYREKYGK